MTIEQHLNLELETDISEFDKLKIHAIDLAKTAGLNFADDINKTKNFKEFEPYFDRIMDEMDNYYGGKYYSELVLSLGLDIRQNY